MQRPVSFFLSFFCVILLVPFLVTILFTGAQVCLVKIPEPGERYLPYFLALEVQEGMPEEAVKAQAVLIRTNLAVEENETVKKENYQRLLDSLVSVKAYEKLLENYVVCEKLAQATTEILSYEEEIRHVPYHAISDGRTRDGAEVFHDQAYGYLVSVESADDLKAPYYGSARYLYGKDFAENIEILSCDSVGYVMQVRVGEQILSGEELRKELQLPSSAFSIQKQGKQVRFMCKGQGHGLGLSQYGAGILANQGLSYIEILKYYFPKMQIR